MMSATSIDHLLNTTVEVRRRQLAPDGMGGQAVEWRTVGEVPARVSNPPTSTTSAVLSAAQTMEKVPFDVYLKADADVRRGDVLVEGGRQLWVETVRWFSVKAYLKASCREWQAEGMSNG